MTYNTEISKKLFAEASQHIPGGVNSPVRAYGSVGGTPPFIVRANGAYLYDSDGNPYIDYVGTWGPAILGHTHPEIIKELYETMKNGLSFGAPTPKEIEIAKQVKSLVPSIEKIRFVNSGTEATMSAIRVARGFTKRDKIIKFDGCYHGHADYLLVQAGSGAQTFGKPNSAGVPESFTEHTLSAEFNNIESVKTIFKNFKDQIACVILEPIFGNMGCIPAKPEFLFELQKICKQNDTVLIFDEVMTGFRVSKSGAQGLYDIQPDMTCFGKIIGGGLPVGAYGGKAEIMNCVAPLGDVYQAGTLSGNPLAMSVGSKTLQLLGKAGVYETLNQKGEFLANGIQQAAKDANVDLQVHQVGSMFSFFFSKTEVKNANDARNCDAKKFVTLFHHMLENGINMAPSAFEAGFISLAHSQDLLEQTLDVFKTGFKKLS